MSIITAGSWDALAEAAQDDMRNAYRYYVDRCDFCPAAVEFIRVPIVEDAPFTELSPTALGSGSDYMATWCAACGPKHRERVQAHPIIRS